MRSLLMCFVMWAVLMVNEYAYSMDMSGDVYKLLQLAKTVRHRPDKQLTQFEVNSVIDACRGGSPDLPKAAAYLFAFTDSQVASNMLTSLSANKSASVAGVAEFSVLLKQVTNLKDSDLLAEVKLRRGHIKHPWGRTLIVSWLGDRFGGKVVTMFLDDLKKEEDPLTRMELLFQVACHGNRDQIAILYPMLKQIKYEGIDQSAVLSTAYGFLNEVSDNPKKRIWHPKYIEHIIQLRLKELP